MTRTYQNMQSGNSSGLSFVKFLWAHQTVINTRSPKKA